jgi:hypothetical protein
MLTAEQARALGPRTDAQRVLDDVERAIKNAAIQSKHQVEVTGIIPNWSGWVAGKPDPALDEVRANLEAAGYRVETYPGGHSGRGYVRIHWNA